MLKEAVHLSSSALLLAVSMLVGIGKVNAADFIVQNDISQSCRLEKYVHSKGSLDDTVDEYEIKVPNGKYAIVSVSGERSVGDVACASGLYVGSRQYINSDIELRCNAGTSYITVRLSVSIFDYQTHACQWQYWIKIKYYDLVPDLTVSRVDLSRSDAAVDETVTLTYTIRNIGQLNVPVSTVARIYDGDKQICGDQAVPPVAAGGVVTQSVTLPRLSAGEHSLKVVADATGAVNESNESNNDGIAQLRVYARTPVEVTFNLNGAGPAERRTVIAGDLLGAPLPLATRRGYAFNGWWTEVGGGAKIAADTKITRDCVFYAHWSAFVSEISFNRQSGTGGDESTTATFDDNTSRVSVPSRRGYVFGGYWQYPNGYGKQYYDESGRSTCRWDCILKEVTLYAKWTAVRGRVNFDFQGGANGTKSTETMFGSALSNVVVPMRSSWVFQGYFSSPNGNGVQYYSSSGHGTRIWNILGDSAVTLYAYWLPVRMDYQVRFDRQSGSGGADGASVTYASDMADIKCPSRAQYIFEGYYSEPNGGGTCYYDQMGRAMQKWDRNQDATLYAKWSKAYRVCFSPNGAVGADRIQYFTERTWQLAKNEYSRSGYVFAGWALESGGAPVLPDESIVSKVLLNLDDDPDADSVTLYAKWGTICSCPQYPGIRFVTGEPAWMVDDDGLRSSREEGTSWLTAIFDNRGTVSFAFTNTSPRRVSARVAYAGGEQFYEKDCRTDGENVIDITSGKRLATWVCKKDAPTLHDWNGQTMTGDLVVLESLLATKEVRQSECKAELFDLMYRLTRGLTNYSDSETAQIVREAISKTIDERYKGVLGGGHILDRVSAHIGSGGLDVTLIKREIRIGSYDGIEMEALAKELEDIGDDINAIEAYRDGFGMLQTLTYDKLQLVGYLLNDSAEHGAAKGLINELNDKRMAFEAVVDEICQNLILLLKASNSYWSFDRQTEAERIICDLFEMDDYWNWSYYISYAYYLDDFDVTAIKQARRVGYYGNIYWSTIESLCQSATETFEDIRSLERQIGDCGVSSWCLVKKGAPIGDLPVPPDRTGYGFDGWWTAPNGGICANENMVVTEDMALYARYELKTFEILFDANGGAGGLGRTVRYGEAIGELPIPIRAGYAFAGWIRQSDGTVASPLDVHLRDETYQAQWTKNTDWAKDNPAVLTYSLSFIANGGMGAMVPIAMETSKVYNLPPNAFIPPAGKKRFAGWAGSNGRRYDDEMLIFNLAQPGGTVRMTAIWE